MELAPSEIATLDIPFFAHALETPVLLALIVLVATMLIHFFVQYLIRGIRLRSQLRAMTARVRNTVDVPPHDVKSALSTIFTDPRTKPAWHEYEETLHEQSELQGAERQIIAVRATVPSQHFISVETIVDPWLGSEYFKHLPGILTGLGIIGTFYGLINGLQQFDPTNLDAASGSGLADLTALFREVKYAFTFSGIAIVLAIAVTAIEKWLYASCAKWVGELTMALDGLFRAGVGEEYLSNLVQASQENANQTRQLKESLVDDLKVLLTNLTDRQVEATRNVSVELGRELQRSLEQPLQQIAETVRIASTRDAQNSGAILETLMTAFMEQMRESMGSQMGDLSGMLAQSARSMAQVEVALRSLVEDMHRSAAAQSAAVSSATADLLAKLGEHQLQQEKAVSSSTKVVMDKLQHAVAQMASAHEEASTRTRASVEHIVGAMKEQVAALAASNQRLTNATAETAGRIHQGTNEVIGNLAAAAGNVERAVSAIGNASERMTELVNRISGLGDQVIRSSQTNAEAAKQLASASQGVVVTTTKLGETAIRLEAVSRESVTEAATRAALVKDLERVAQASREAALEFSGLTAEVEKHLIDNIEAFGSGVGQALEQHLGEYQKQLGNAVDILRNALIELGEYAEGAKA